MPSHRAIARSRRALTYPSDPNDQWTWQQLEMIAGLDRKGHAFWAVVVTTPIRVLPDWVLAQVMNVTGARRKSQSEIGRHQ
jgi:hypothetical protein